MGQMSALGDMHGGPIPSIADADFYSQIRSQSPAILNESGCVDGYRSHISPLHKMPSNLDGLEALQEDSCVNGHGQSPRRRTGNIKNLRLGLPATPSTAELAMSALQYLPYPVMVLNSLKTLILANVAMRRLLNIDDERDGTMNDGTGTPGMDKLCGRTLGQLGVDMLQGGRPVWVNWESFLDSIATDLASPPVEDEPVTPEPMEGGGTPTAPMNTSKNVSTVHDSVVEIVLSPASISASFFATKKRKSLSGNVTFAKMIITVWEINNENFFTLSFTDTGPGYNSVPNSRGQSRQVPRSSTSVCPGSSAPCSPAYSTTSPSSGRSPYSPAILTPSIIAMSASPFPPLGPPLGPPSRTSNPARVPSSLQKIIVMKDALLDNTEVPIIAMWKDGSLAVRNKAAREVYRPDIDFDQVDGVSDIVSLLSSWDETFTNKLDPEDLPINELIRTQTPFKSRKIGIYHPNTGRKLIYDCVGEAVLDENTGEFLAGVVTCRDITSMTEQMNAILEKDEQRFQLICDSMPQMIWTATSEGLHDWFSWKWYEYTGLTEAESLGLGWKLPIHPDDIDAAESRWAYSLRTGAPYSTEYRCLSKDGEWRWMLGRALPMKNKKTDEIEEWFGTCTEIHEAVEARLEARRTREQLLSVITHGQVTLFSVDRDRKINLLEGAYIWDLKKDEGSGIEGGGHEYIGKNVYEVFSQAYSSMRGDEIPSSLKPIEEILTGKKVDDVQEDCIDNRWFRTKFLPVYSKVNEADDVKERFVDGVIGISTEITMLKAKEADLQMQEKENTRLMANEAAAKEASRLKSQFLANMSHEIRTPIAGVIGMADLLTDMELNEEQLECAQNIQGSANGLLTVINDILDFSKVESGRLDIEEVQFSLSVLIRDVSKMLGFAAERKSLTFESEITVGMEKELIIMGDPGRVRQILTNLLTNSIKFTSSGRVKFSVLKERETSDIFEVKFVVEDTGIGIEEEVRKRLFKPFSQADSSTARRFGGTGLGLTICKNLVDLMHGKITLESSLGTGTTATFWIPFNKPQYHEGIDTLIDVGSLPDRLQSEMSVSCSGSEYERSMCTPSSKSPIEPHLQQTNRSKNKTSRPAALPELDLSPAERAKIKILVVEDNRINQQIALKTIRKLGFIVSAVWNGKEALDYLLAAETPNPPHPKPDIILMDCQMPIIDGYRATHIIRHHPPYNLATREIPIVAMTASAIQGDGEKCMKAGMDDYLSKPVKGPTLEKMLVRWAISRRVQQSSEGRDYDGGEGAEPGEYDCCQTLFSTSGLPVTTTQVNYPNTQPSPTTISERRNSQCLNLPGTESEGDRVQKMEEAELKAISLRDSKLIVAAGGMPEGKFLLAEIVRSEGQKLTVENIGKLEEERRKSNPRSETRNLSVQPTGSMVAETESRDTGDERDMNGVRPKVTRRWRDSEQTIAVEDENAGSFEREAVPCVLRSEQEVEVRAARRAVEVMCDERLKAQRRWRDGERTISGLGSENLI